MISKEYFKQLIISPESSVLDFKRKMYDFDSNDNKIGSYVKDVISFSNTIRTESAFIIIGIGETENNEKEYVGIDNIIDESILQAKVMNKVYPRPEFSFYTMGFDDIVYGVFEFPVFKFPYPLSSNIKLKGIEAGQVYHRKGSSNSNATSLESIHINDWLRGLPVISSTTSIIRDDITSYVNRITKNNELLSTIFLELLERSRIEGNIPLESFCKNELQGLPEIKGKSFVDKSKSQFKYRALKVYQSVYDLDFGYMDTQLIRTELENSDKAHETEMIFNQTLFQIEEYSRKLRTSKSQIFRQSTPLSTVFPDKPDAEGLMIYRYLLPETFSKLQNKISQKLIEVLLNL